MPEIISGDRNPFGQLLLPLESTDSSKAEPFTPSLPSDLRTALHQLLEADLDFHGQDSSYASHNFHAFAAKFPPQLPRYFIDHLTVPGEIVLDPMMGSGTTIAEAILARRKAIGCDLDSLALHVSQVKTTPLDANRLLEASGKLRRRIYELLTQKTAPAEALERRFDVSTRKFLDYWFLEITQRELMAILLGIEAESQEEIRRFFTLAFSSIIITKSGGVSLARDLAHSRPHLDKEKVPRSALEQFDRRLRKNIEGIAGLSDIQEERWLIHGDARSLPLRSQTVHLIVTSPPYANAIDYMRAHSHAWDRCANPSVPCRNRRLSWLSGHWSGPQVSGSK